MVTAIVYGYWRGEELCYIGRTLGPRTEARVALVRKWEKDAITKHRPLYNIVLNKTVQLPLFT